MGLYIQTDSNVGKAARLLELYPDRVASGGHSRPSRIFLMARRRSAWLAMRCLMLPELLMMRKSLTPSTNQMIRVRRRGSSWTPNSPQIFAQTMRDIFR